ncbi:helix-turn-helix domain-containing protein [Mesobacillus subterraneus]|uniref:helix-turn-helix transcriptional regulator n=1 Tax=Mesobacillus subterraneus TaxID=285983 RepID=UPI001CFD6139|nr:helix-turn-helix domain-containing protein [Mesobacillus subterraneus]WLR53592.1 helix-turn-helix domain-containing protein [Mesobacillus subterraneus]
MVQEYPALLNAKHVSEILGVSLRHAYELMEQNDFPLVRIGRTKRVIKDDLVTWINKHKKEA